LLALLSFITSSTVSCRTAASTTTNQNTEELEALHHARSNRNTEQPGKKNHYMEHPAMHHATTTYQKKEELFAPHHTVLKSNLQYVLPEKELCGLSPNSYILFR
jgi:hypothetical protein